MVVMPSVEIQSCSCSTSAAVASVTSVTLHSHCLAYGSQILNALGSVIWVQQELAGLGSYSRLLDGVERRGCPGWAQSSHMKIKIRRAAPQMWLMSASLQVVRCVS